jgi:hypothetical protein
MSERVAVPLSDLYELDETAWLEQMSKLAAERRFAKMDHEHLSEYLSDMAIRDRREVKSRLTTLLIHLLKWEFQAKKRTGSWRNSALEQQQELTDLLESGTLRRHAEEVLSKAYDNAVKRAAAETRLSRTKFPAELPWTLDDALARELDD